ncbi:kinase-like domain-containing protein [Xylariaceae sp. FL1019]|nr:kinase-like domain-containing protein [Xylariaceae sp. FL1019]
MGQDIDQIDVTTTVASDSSVVNNNNPTTEGSHKSQSTTTPIRAESVKSATHETPMVKSANNAQVERGSPTRASAEGFDADTRPETFGDDGKAHDSISVSEGETSADFIMQNDEKAKDTSDGSDAGHDVAKASHSDDSDDAEGENKDDPDQEYKYNYLHAEAGLEDVTRYNKGGFHPIALDDMLGDRFKVVGKLGSGGFGTVWLCRDTKLQKWRAVKVMAADHSKDSAEVKIHTYLKYSCPLAEIERYHIAVPLEFFWIDGPNGRHLCAVMELYGESVESWRIDQNDFEPGTKSLVAEVCGQIVRGVAFLHQNAICHGDLRPSNILMRLDQDALDNIGENEMEGMLGKVEAWEVQTASGGSPDERAPKTLIEADRQWSDQFVIHEAVITDFGEAFFASEAPKATGIPLPYNAPENLFEYGPGLEIDLWSLGCTLYEVRTRDQLFGAGFSYTGTIELPEVIHEQEVLLGRLPQPYWSAFNCAYRGKDMIIGGGIIVKADTSLDDDDEPTATSSTNRLREIRLEKTKNSEYDDVLQAKLGVVRGQIVNFIDGGPEAWEASSSLKMQYSREEVLNIADTIHSLLQWEPSQRESAKKVLQREWLKNTVAAKENLASMPLDTPRTPTPDLAELISEQITPKRRVLWRAILVSAAISLLALAISQHFFHSDQVQIPYMNAVRGQSSLTGRQEVVPVQCVCAIPVVFSNDSQC